MDGIYFSHVEGIHASSVHMASWFLEDSPDTSGGNGGGFLLHLRWSEGVLRDPIDSNSRLFTVWFIRFIPKWFSSSTLARRKRTKFSRIHTWYVHIRTLRQGMRHLVDVFGRWVRIFVKKKEKGIQDRVFLKQNSQKKVESAKKSLSPNITATMNYISKWIWIVVNCCICILYFVCCFCFSRCTKLKFCHSGGPLVALLWGPP